LLGDNQTKLPEVEIRQLKVAQYWPAPHKWDRDDHETDGDKEHNKRQRHADNDEQQYQVQ